MKMKIGPGTTVTIICIVTYSLLIFGIPSGDQDEEEIEETTFFETDKATYFIQGLTVFSDADTTVYKFQNASELEGFLIKRKKEDKI